MTGILQQIMNTMDQTRELSALDSVSMIGFAALLILGVINCVLGYRLLRFWMMLFGFLIGGGIGLGVAYTMGIQEKYMYAVIMIGVGILLAVVAFLSYKIGIFIIGAGIGLGLGIYVFHPTTSLVFFFCLLLGVGLGALAMKWAREVLIVGTSLLGGIMAGFSLAKLGGLADIPYGLGLSVACALLGMLIQFATNRRRVEEEEEEYDPEEYENARKSSDYIDAEDYFPGRRKEAEESYPEGRNRRSRGSAEEDNHISRKKRGVDGRMEKSKQKRAVDTQLERPDRKRKIDVRPEKKNLQKQNSDRSRQGRMTQNHRLDDPAPDYEQTVVYRPKRTSASGGRNTDQNIRRSQDVYEDDYYDEEPIDEELLDEQVIQEMMDEDDREGEAIWNKISRKNTRRNKNAR